MSARKPMGGFWAVLAVSDTVLSAGRRILLAKMYLLDNGSRGCSATAAVLGLYTGLTERTVDKYRRELEALGLVFAVPRTRGWHLNLPTGLPGDRATDSEIQEFARRIEAQIGVTETTPEGVESPQETPMGQPHATVKENTPGGAANRTAGCGDVGPESTPGGGDSVAKDGVTVATGLMSTQETRETALTSALLRNRKGTHEGVGAAPIRKPTVPLDLEAKRRAWRDAVEEERTLRDAP